jgi:hypothetical protein
MACRGVTLDTLETDMLAVLIETREFLRRPENDFAWSSWDEADLAISEIDSHIATIEQGDLTTLTKLEVLFAPTGPIQEVSVSSGWGREFLGLAARFDAALATLRSRYPTS